MKVNLTKRDLECIHAGCTGHYLHTPDEYDDPHIQKSNTTNGKRLVTK